jgi:hypothetical protein
VANRPYLYSADRLDDWDHPANEPEKDYYDSRWVIPLAWFFFYAPSNIRMVDMQFGKSQWQEIKLAADKVTATDLFMRRRGLFFSIVENQIEENDVMQFLAELTAWPGQFLLLDPGEVLHGMTQNSHGTPSNLPESWACWTRTSQTHTPFWKPPAHM